MCAAVYSRTGSGSKPCTAYCTDVTAVRLPAFACILVKIELKNPGKLGNSRFGPSHGSASFITMDGEESENIKGSSLKHAPKSFEPVVRVPNKTRGKTETYRSGCFALPPVRKLSILENVPVVVVI